MAADLERFGRHMYDQIENSWPWRSVYDEFILPMYHYCRADQDTFLTELADLAEENEGWTAYGAERLMIEMIGGNLNHPTYGRIMNSSLAFLRATGVPPKMVTGYEWDHWLASGGSLELWVSRRPVPTPAQAPISGLAPGQRRRLAQLTREDQSSAYFVQRAPEGNYSLILDVRYSYDDPRRTERTELTAESLHELYVWAGLVLQTPPYWFDRELEPYFPLPMPTL
jgi:hypothetical protein